MTMSSLARENGVLKLVYPGGLVETHKQPITAAEVMKRNPRHCVTRPDVFKFPWIVVRPQSVLRPGMVFYIVPYHTMHRLLQRTSKVHSSDMQVEQLSPEESGVQAQLFFCNEVNLEKYRDQPVEGSRSEKHLKQCTLPPSSSQIPRDSEIVKKQPPSVSSQKKVNPRHEEESHGEQSVVKVFDQVKISQSKISKAKKKLYPVECWPTRLPSLKIQDNPHSPGSSFVEDRVPAYTRQGRVTVPQNDSRLLKSCLKTNQPNTRGLRVTFANPIDDDNKK